MKNKNDNLENLFLNVPVFNEEELAKQERARKISMNINILRTAIANGDKVNDTLKKLDKSYPIGENISFMVKNGRFVKKPLQLDLFEVVE